MNDLISREATLDALKGFNVVDMISYEHGVIYVQAVINAIYNRLNNLPSAEPERKKGKWVMHSDYPDRLICSECTRQFDVWHWESKQMHFCPNCGADMWSENE